MNRFCDNCRDPIPQGDGWHYDPTATDPPQFKDYDLCNSCAEWVKIGRVSLPIGMDPKRFKKPPRVDLALLTEILQQFEMVKVRLETIDLKLVRMEEKQEQIEKRLLALEAVSHKQPSMEDMFRSARQVNDEVAQRQTTFQAFFNPAPKSNYKPPPHGYC